MGNRLDWAILRPAIGSRPEFVFFPYFFFSLLCVCVSYSLANDEVRKEKERAGKRRGSSFCFFFSLLFIYPLIYDSSKWRLPAPPWRRCSCCHPSKRRFGFGFKKFQRVYVGSHLVVPSFTVIFVSVWVLAGFFWVFLDFTGFYWVCLGFIGFYWTWVRFTGFYWVYWTFIVFVRVFTVFFLYFTGIYWVLLSWCRFVSRFHWVLLNLSSFYGVLPSFTGFWWILMGFYWFLSNFTGFYWNLLDFTRFYWVLLGF